MELVNELSHFDLDSDPGTEQERCFVFKFAVETVLRVLAPFAPHLAEELWEMLGHDGSIFAKPWPGYDPKALLAEEIVIVVQVDGKLRTRLSLPASSHEEAIKQAALEDKKIKQWLQGREVKQVVVVPKRLVNIVTS
ncbi:MAG: class I tRNA ligase family protein, partial [candidate division NC10 bacterium]|nr:class I tRNA ligase family protein [candidate division NC10 bacterium]